MNKKTSEMVVAVIIGFVLVIVATVLFLPSDIQNMGGGMTNAQMGIADPCPWHNSVQRYLDGQMPAGQHLE